jgi:hypothetical protein
VLHSRNFWKRLGDRYPLDEGERYLEEWSPIVDRRSPALRKLWSNMTADPAAAVVWNVFRTIELADRLEILSHSSCLYPRHAPVAKLVDYGPRYYYWGVSESGEVWEPLERAGRDYPLRVPEVVIEGNHNLYYVEHLAEGRLEPCPFATRGECYGESCPVLGRIRESKLVLDDAFFFDPEFVEHVDCNVYHQVFRAVATGSYLANVVQRRPRFVFILNRAAVADLNEVERAVEEARSKLSPDAELRLTSWQDIGKKVERAVVRGHRDATILHRLEELFLYLNGPEFRPAAPAR